ncbi:DUF4387 domain-containing protein [Streptomyces sp. NRRL B-3648]|uniref:DUF4387 domain-containing protein n=1 Tax=Streptomyces sp. NRRL B-3648 TaxID=1519493 RepID=UPI0006BFD085|nr:DUF4387 domain-containing protein [Streptomyces sp. NRRL B-3648]KOV93743.1 hypothetical protein ADL04_26565 [Streptomyces sp. NRRL B-3648]
MTQLSEVATDIRSKNAGPFWITVDVFLPDEETYHRATTSSLTDPLAIGAQFSVDPDHIRVFPLPELRVIKISLPRPRAQGSRGERDMHAGQQFVPLLGIHIGS